MACQGCLEMRAKMLSYIGIKPRAPVSPIPVRVIEDVVAEDDVFGVPSSRELFAKYFAASDGSTAADIIYGASSLIAVALVNICPDGDCGERGLQQMVETIRLILAKHYDPVSGKKRDLVLRVREVSDEWQRRQGPEWRPSGSTQ